MSLRALALELYRAQQKVDRLEKQRTAAPEEKQKSLDEELQGAQAEVQQLRKMLDGAKGENPFATTGKNRPRR